MHLYKVQTSYVGVIPLQSQKTPPGGWFYKLTSLKKNGTHNTTVLNV